MKSILELISKYKSDVIIIPILAVLALVLSFSIYYFFTKKSIKYILGLVALVLGVLLLLVGYLDLLNPSGLSFIGWGINLMVFAVVSLAFSAIIDLLDGLGANFGKNKKKEDQDHIEEKVKKIEELEEKSTKRANLRDKEDREDKTKRIDLEELRKR